MRALSVVFSIVVILGLAGVAGATDQSMEARLDAEGFVKISEGYWERLTDESKIETVAYGTAGLQQVLANLNREMVMLVQEYISYPDERMLDTLESHLKHIAAVESNMAKSIQAEIEPALRCSIGYAAEAGGTTGCFNYAEANAYYWGSSAKDCFGLCDLSAYSYVRRVLCDDNVITMSESGFRNDVINDEVTADVTLSSAAALSCYAYASAYVSCPDISLYQSVTDTSTYCGLCLLCPPFPIEEELQ